MRSHVCIEHRRYLHYLSSFKVSEPVSGPEENKTHEVAKKALNDDTKTRSLAEIAVIAAEIDYGSHIDEPISLQNDQSTAQFYISIMRTVTRELPIKTLYRLRLEYFVYHLHVLNSL